MPYTKRTYNIQPHALNRAAVLDLHHEFGPVSVSREKFGRTERFVVARHKKDCQRCAAEREIAATRTKQAA